MQLTSGNLLSYAITWVVAIFGHYSLFVINCFNGIAFLIAFSFFACFPACLFWRGIAILDPAFFATAEDDL